jgi:VWFA-related protein
MRFAVGALVCVAGLSLALSAQQSPRQPPPTFQSGVDVVLLDVSVLDKQRRPVRGLTAEDFTILEDGKPRSIAAFTAIDLPGAPGRTDAQPPAAKASWVRDVAADTATNDISGEGRLVVIMLDRTIEVGFPTTAARRIAAAAIDQLAPGDLAAVVYTVNGAQPQNFTSDRARLRKALEGSPRGTELSDEAQEFNRNFNRNLPGEVVLPTTSGNCYCGVCVPEAISQVALSLQDVPQRRKSLIFIGRGISVDGPIPPYIEIEMLNTPLGQDCVHKVKDAREEMFRAAALANLTITTLDPSGLQTQAISASSTVRASAAAIERDIIRDINQKRQASLRVVAETTGGRAVLDSNDPAELVPAIFQESSSYYVLGFRSADRARDGRFHKIEVKVNRSGLNVRTRNGFTAPSAIPSVVSGAPLLSGTMKDLLPNTGLRMSATAMPFASRDAPGATVLIALDIQQAKVEPAPGGPEHVEIFASAFDRRGRSPGWMRQTVEVTPSEGGSGTLQYHAVTRLDLRPGTYEIRIAASHRDAARSGSVYTHVEVPDFSKELLSLSGVVLQGGTPRLATPRAVFETITPIVPISRREFLRGETVTVFARVYQGGQTPVTDVATQVRVVNTDAKAVFAGTATLAAGEFGDARSTDLKLDVPLQRLAAGEYLLTLDVTSGTRVARRDVRFTVR